MIRAILASLLLCSVACAQGVHLGEKRIDDTIRFSVNIHDGFGEQTDADSAPTYRIYENGTYMTLTGSMSLLDDANTTGYYGGSVVASAANGFEVDKSYEIRVVATAASTTGSTSIAFDIVDDWDTIIQAANATRFTTLDTAVANLNTDVNVMAESVESLSTSGTTVATGVTISVGTATAGTFASTATVNATSHTIQSAGPGEDPSLVAIYDFDLATAQVPTSISITASTTPNGTGLSAYAYNYSTAAWVALGNVTETTLTTDAYPLGADYADTDGAIQIKFEAPEAHGGDYLNIDGLIISYSENLGDLIDEVQASSTVTADRVPKQLTYSVGSEGNAARNIVTLNAWSSGTRTLAFDLSELLDQSDTTISTVSAVTVVKGVTSIATSDLRKHQNQKVAMWDTAAISSANVGDYTVTVTVTTADSNTIVVTGTLRVE